LRRIVAERRLDPDTRAEQYATLDSTATGDRSGCSPICRSARPR
jgi:hypothetical protein